jgi:hypothetical protein
LLSAHRRRPAEAAEAGSNFELERIEGALVQQVLAHATPLAVVVHHYRFRGELQRSGRLGRLKQRVAQRALPDAVMEVIWTELDTQQREQALMGVLEQAIAFVSGAGGEAEMLLGTYAQQVLMLAEQWGAASTPTIDREVRLCHLQALFMAMEEGNEGGAGGVHVKYTEPLGESVHLDESLRREERREALTAALHDLLATQLQEGNWGAHERLRDFLGFAAPELEEEEWFVRDFPHGAELRHAVAVYKWLRGAGGAVS